MFKRDVKENLNDPDSNDEEGNYYVDDDLLRELTNQKNSNNTKQTARASKSKSRLNLNDLEYTAMPSHTHTGTQRDRYVETGLGLRHHAEPNRNATINGRRVRQLNELFENQMSVR